MESLAKKMAQATEANQAATSSPAPEGTPAAATPPAAPAVGHGGLLEAMQKAAGAGAVHPTLQQAHATLQDANAKLTPGQFQDATASAINNLSPETTAQLMKVLEQLGAPATADAGAAAGGSPQAAKLAAMLHWVQTNVPGGIPAVLALLGAAGGAAVVGSGAGGDVSGAVSSSLNDIPGGHIVHSILGSLLPAIQGAVSKVSG